MTMFYDLTIRDIRIGDIYEHDLGGFYIVTEVLTKTQSVVGNRLNSTHAKDEHHDINTIRNLYGMYR